MTRMICHLEAIDLLTDRTVYIIEDMSADGYIYDTASDLTATLTAYNNSIYNQGYKAIDVYKVEDYYTGKVIFDDYG